ncbi:ParA family protein [Brucella sp. 22210]|uniref:ParA family protein n=1 Tax=Brucella sp. 22210 TaxID=3453892 RepID=UPI003F839A5C
MLKIALVSQKGGVGKTVISQVLVNAALAKSEDIKVLLIETDDQGSSATYHLRATNRYPDLGARFHCTVCTDETALESGLAEADGFDYVIIDTAGSHKELSKHVLGDDNKVIIPFRPRLKEYESQLETLRLYEQVKISLEENGFPAPAVRLLLNDWSD